MSFCASAATNVSAAANIARSAMGANMRLGELLACLDLWHAAVLISAERREGHEAAAFRPEPAPLTPPPVLTSVP